MNAFEKIATHGILPFIVEGLGRRWATDGHRMLIEDMLIEEDGYKSSFEKDRVTRVRDLEDGDRTAPPSAHNMSGVVPDWYDPRTIKLTDPKRLVRVVKSMLKLQEKENEPRIAEWKKQLDRMRARVNHAHGAHAKSVAKSDVVRVKADKPRPEKYGKFGSMPDVTLLRSASNAIVEPIGRSFPKAYQWEREVGEGSVVNLYFLLDALEALRGKGEVKLQLTAKTDPIMLGAGNMTAVIMPYNQ